MPANKSSVFGPESDSQAADCRDGARTMTPFNGELSPPFEIVEPAAWRGRSRPVRGRPWRRWCTGKGHAGTAWRATPGLGLVDIGRNLSDARGHAGIAGADG